MVKYRKIQVRVTLYNFHKNYDTRIRPIGFKSDLGGYVA